MHLVLVPADHQGLREGIVRAREGETVASWRGDLEAVHDDVEVAALERRDQHLPVVLHERGPHAEAAGQRIGDLDLEADERPGSSGSWKT